MTDRRKQDLVVRPHGNQKWAIWGNGKRKPLRVVKTWSEAGVIAYFIAMNRKVNVQMIGIEGANADGSSTHSISEKDEILERILAEYECETAKLAKKNRIRG